MTESNNKGYLIISHIITILFLVQIILSLIFYNWARIDLLTYAGWLIIITGVTIFIKALVDFRVVKKTDLKKGEIVDIGLFSIIRHPMYFSFILMAFGLIFISQYWLVVIIGTLRIFMLYYVILAEERMDIDRFGSPYRDYQKRVPRLNFIKGILKRSN